MNENENNLAPEVNTDDWSDIDLSDVTDEAADSTAETESDKAAEEVDSKPAETENAEQPTETEAKPEETPEADHSFEVNYMGQLRKVSREEAPQLIQKGLDYDRVRGKYNELQERVKDYDELSSFVNELAQSSGVDAKTLMERTRVNLLAKREGISEETARERISLDKRKRELDAREQAMNQQNAQQQAQLTEKQRIDKEFTDFFKARPDVKASDVPKEVFKQLQEGGSLLTAYTQYENQKLKQELEAERQNRKNAEKSAGSASSAGKQNKMDAIDADWYDGT